MLFVLAFLGGVLTILSPCILPVLPFVFTRTGQPFLRSGLPLLVGMAVTFAIVATLAAVGGGWVVQANEYGRWAALAVMIVLGVSLLVPSLAQRLTRPFVALGNRLSASARPDANQRSSFVLGVATGLLWAPCAGPILGLVLTGAALRGASAETSLLLLAYAAGSAVSLAAALLVGGKVLAAMKRTLGAEEWIRRALGTAVIVAAVAIALGLDTGYLARISTASTTRLEELLFAKLMPDGAPSALDSQGPAMTGGSAMRSAESAMRAADTAMRSADGAMRATNPAMIRSGAHEAGVLPVLGKLPPLDGATTWLNSAPLTAKDLRGKVVVVDFWTYSCINCLRALPYVEAWYEKYRDEGLVVIGVHSPEFAFEKDLDNVKRAVRRLDVSYPVAVDNDYAIWRAFANEYWPAHYFVDAEGNIRRMHFGEGEYDVSERVIQQLLAEAGRAPAATSLVEVEAGGAAMSSDRLNVLSPETYVGHERAEHFASPGGMAPDDAHEYTAPEKLRLNQWALDGRWTVGREQAVLDAAGGRIVFHFQARDLHLVLGPGPDGRPVDFTIRIDGEPPGAHHGSDVDAGGRGTVSEQRLYQLVRQSGEVLDRTFEIEFSAAGVAAYAFTFG